MTEPLIEFKNVTKRFGELTVLDGVDLSIYKGDVTTIIGKSGVGKSVLIKHIIGLLSPDAGVILYEGKSLSSLTRKEKKRLKQNISYMFQHNALFDSMTVFDNIALPLREKTNLPSGEIRKRVMEQIKSLELGHVPNKYPSQLSGGMQKRTALARALITNPKVVLFDEPTTGLDPIRKNSVLTMIAHYQRAFGFTAVLVSHDIPDVFYISNRTALIEEGKILFQGSPIEIEQSAHPVVSKFTRSLTALKDDLTGLCNRKELEARYRLEFGRTGEKDRPFIAFMFTIENLGQVDSMAGNISSQRIIQSVARFLQERMGSDSWSGRYGVSQILSFVPDSTREQAERFLDDLAHEMKQLTIFQPLHYPSICIHFSVWVGLAEGRPGMDFRTVVESVWSNERKLAQLVCGKTQA